MRIMPRLYLFTYVNSRYYWKVATGWGVGRSFENICKRYPVIVKDTKTISTLVTEYHYFDALLALTLPYYRRRKPPKYYWATKEKGKLRLNEA